MFHTISPTYLLHTTPALYLQLSRYFWSTFRSVKVSAPYRALFQI